MALSQIQCLDDNHVNPRTHESKPEFLYCEEQRLALEALLRDGREAFAKHLETRGLRGFLSDLERETLSAAAEPFDPDSDVLLLPASADGDEGGTPLSLQYWPELSDTSAPQMDLGWPDCDSYRGVTRTSVYTQPPLDGQAHIKEVVRKMIAQAQKVIAVVMDLFTDVDIFRDLLDAGFKRKVSIYILLERTTLPHFLSMCQRANMHAGHLKHLRVCCAGGVEFYTRHCTKVTGRLGYRFMFIDGDKAVTGSYSFTWMSSRLDRNLITVITGQAVDAFDQLFRFLYMTSTAVDLRKVVTEPEPQPDSRPHVASVIAPSAAVARKLHNPKYALVALTNSNPTTSFGNGSPKEPEASEKPKKKEPRRMSEDSLPLHPGLTNLEKANLIPYLPTWPEPDPPSDVIGFINIRDSNKATQVHLQRSERFETSQAIKFSSPLSKPQEPLPEVATPRKITPQHKEMNKLPLAQNESKTKELVVDTAVPGHNKVEDKAPEQTSSPCSQKSVPDEDKTKALKAESKLCSNTARNPDAGHVTPGVSRDTPPQTFSKTPSSNMERPSNKAGTVSTTSPKSDLLTLSSLYKRQEIFPEGVIPGQITGKHEGMKNPQPEQNEPKSSELVTDGAAPGYDKSKAKAPGEKSSRQKSELDNNHFNVLKLDKKVCLNTAINPDAVHDTASFGPNTPPHFSNKTPLSNKESFTNKAEIVSTASSKAHSNESKPKEVLVDTSALGHNKSKDKAPDQKTPPCGQKDETKVFKTGDKLCLNTAINLSHDTHDLSPNTLPQSSAKVPSSNKEKPSNQTETVSTRLRSDSNEAKPKDLVVATAGPGHNKRKDKAPDQKLTSQKSVPEQDDTKVLKTDNKVCLNPDSGHNKPDLSPETPPQSSKKTSMKERLLNKMKTASTASLKSDSLSQSEPDLTKVASRLINTQEAIKPTQGSEISQAVKVSGPLSNAQGTLPEVPVPRQITVKHEELSKPQPAQNEPKAKALVVDIARPGQKSPQCSQKSVPDKDETKVLKMVNEHSSNTAISPGAEMPPKSSSKTPQSNKERLSNKAEPASTTMLKSDSLTELEPDPARVGGGAVTSQDANKPMQIHAQHTDMQEVSQALKFISLLNKLQETFPEVAAARPITAKHEETSKLQPAQNVPKAKELVAADPGPDKSKDKVPEQKSPPRGQKSAPDKGETKVPKTEKKLSDAGHNTPDLSSNTPPLSSNKALSSSKERPLSQVKASPTQSEGSTSLSNPDAITVVPVERDQAAPGVQRSSASNRGARKEQNQEKRRKEDGECRGTAGALPVTGTKLKTQSDPLNTAALKTASANIQGIIPNDVDSKTSMSTNTKTGSVTTAQTEETLTNCDLAKETHLIQPQTYLVRSHEPQRILFSKFTSQGVDVLGSLKAPVNDTTQSPSVLKDGVDDRIHTRAGNALSQPGKQVQVTLKQTDSLITNQEQTQTSTSAPEKALHFNFPLAQAANANSPTTKLASKSAAVNARTPDAFPSRSPTLDSRTASPDPRRYTPDFRSPASDASDEYVSPRQDSTFSNTSEEFYQCCDSPLKEFVLDPRDGYTSLTNTNTSPATAKDTSPKYLNYSPTTAGQNTSNPEVSLLSRTTGVASSLLGINAQKSERKEVTKANGKDEDVWVRRTNQGSQGSKGTDNQDAIRTMKHGQCKDDLAEMEAKGEEAQSPTPKRAPIHSAADNVVDRGGRETEPKRRSVGDLKPEGASSEDQQEKTSSRREEARKPNAEERRGRQSTRETKGQKVLTNSSKLERPQQQGNGPPSSPRTVKSPRPLPGSLDSGASRAGSQSASRVFYSGFKVSDSTSAPRRTASRSPAPAGRAPVGAGAGRKQGPNSLVSRQPAATQTRSKADQSQTQAPARPASYLYTHPNLQPQLGPQGPMQRGSEQAAPEQDEGRGLFSLPFGQLYSFRGLRDKWAKPQTQAKKSGASAPGKERKSTS
ncbi:uncharacterized protein LOC108242989 [Kryptolebias marmoratus]|uniref:Uncharacterized LOC108242989 n=1 Tax=Kryptolebias marmoratus TaxID=37003 RepID=A0A3Q3FD40_KRYMA|nr:uncharacterized protein LOC108242989 [Kryptolebias marmoratus]